MDARAIEKYVEHEDRKNNIITISFKDRNNVAGLFIQQFDYEELKKKNFWRIVSFANLKDWEKTNNPNLARIYSGSSFSKLTERK
ncbi:MAG: short-chain dehydrogenase [Sphingobacteriia bacterium]|nr:short-chain dehydrogenase [Sphingobacteriia bacterium]